MRNIWRALIVLVLVTAVSAVMVAKRNPAERPIRRHAQGQPATSATRKGLPELIELGSKTCVPCQKMEPILDELRKDYKGQLEVTFYDVYEHRDKAQYYHIHLIPTQVFIGCDGQEFSRHEGFFPKEEIVARFKGKGIVLTGAR
jgi:thioredoxin 1